MDLDHSGGEARIATGTLNEGGNGGFANFTGDSKELNYEAILNFNKTFKKITVNANAGAISVKMTFGRIFNLPLVV